MNDIESIILNDRYCMDLFEHEWLMKKYQKGKRFWSIWEQCMAIKTGYLV